MKEGWLERLNPKALPLPLTDARKINISINTLRLTRQRLCQGYQNFCWFGDGRWPDGTLPVLSCTASVSLEALVFQGVGNRTEIWFNDEWKLSISYKAMSRDVSGSEEQTAIRSCRSMPLAVRFKGSEPLALEEPESRPMFLRAHTGQKRRQRYDGYQTPGVIPSGIPARLAE